MQVFISYRHKDKKYALEIRNALKSQNFDVWLDIDNIPILDQDIDDDTLAIEPADWAEHIDNGLKSSSVIVGLYSQDAIASRNVTNEWNWALHNNRPLLLVLLEDIKIEQHRFVDIPRVSFTNDSALRIQHMLEKLSNINGLIPKTLADDVTTTLPQSIAPDSKEADVIRKIRERWINPILGQAEIQSTTLPVKFKLEAEHPTADYQDLPAHEAITPLFDKSRRDVVVLGEGGAGKTFTMLHLARALLLRAERDTNAPIPIIFSAPNSFEAQGIEWLFQLFEQEYELDEESATQWLNSGRVVIIADGFDEFMGIGFSLLTSVHHRFPLLRMIITSRIGDYDSGKAELIQDGLSVMTLSSLEDAQIEDYIRESPELDGLRQTMGVHEHNDQVLWGMARSVYLLIIIRTAYLGLSADEITPSDTMTSDERVHHVFENYVKAQYEQQSTNRGFDYEQIGTYMKQVALMAGKSALSTILPPNAIALMGNRNVDWAQATMTTVPVDKIGKVAKRMGIWMSLLTVSFTAFILALFMMLEGDVRLFPLLISAMIGASIGIIAGRIMWYQFGEKDAFDYAMSDMDDNQLLELSQYLENQSTLQQNPFLSMLVKSMASRATVQNLTQGWFSGPGMTPQMSVTTSVLISAYAMLTIMRLTTLSGRFFSSILLTAVIFVSLWMLFMYGLQANTINGKYKKAGITPSRSLIWEGIWYHHHDGSKLIMSSYIIVIISLPFGILSSDPASLLLGILVFALWTGFDTIGYAKASQMMGSSITLIFGLAMLSVNLIIGGLFGPFAVVSAMILKSKLPEYLTKRAVDKVVEPYIPTRTNDFLEFASQCGFLRKIDDNSYLFPHNSLREFFSGIMPSVHLASENNTLLSAPPQIIDSTLAITHDMVHGKDTSQESTELIVAKPDETPVVVANSSLVSSVDVVLEELRETQKPPQRGRLSKFTRPIWWLISTIHILLYAVYWLIYVFIYIPIFVIVALLSSGRLTGHIDRYFNRARILYHTLEIWTLPRNAFAYYMRGHAYYDLKKYDLAKSSFERSIQVGNGIGHAYAQMGYIAFWHDEDYDLAQVLFGKTLAQYPKDGFSNCFMGLSAYEKKQWDGALLHLKKAVELEYKEEYSSYMIGKIYWMRREYELAEQYLRNSINEKKPSSYRFRYSRLLLTLMEALQFDKALELLNGEPIWEAMSENKDELVYRQAQVNLWRERHNITALEKFEVMVPDFGNKNRKCMSYMWLSVLYGQLGEASKSKEMRDAADAIPAIFDDNLINGFRAVVDNDLDTAKMLYQEYFDGFLATSSPPARMHLIVLSHVLGKEDEWEIFIQTTWKDVI